MNNERTTVVDFVARGDTPDEWRIVLVEEGPWTGSIEAQLHRLQDRLYGAIDAALDGKLAEQFPESKGKNVVIRLDGYNLPKSEVTDFFDRFSEGALLIPDYKRALNENQFIKSIRFQAKFES
jgi:hypothetical protein